MLKFEFQPLLFFMPEKNTILVFKEKNPKFFFSSCYGSVSADSEPKHKENFFGVFSSQIKNALFQGSKILAFETKV